MARDSILESDFNRQTIYGLRNFLQDHDGHDSRLNAPVESWAFLYFQLREAEDKGTYFPSGKWATIQRLESLLMECAKPNC